MSADEDTELRDLVAQTLEANGVLGKIRAQLRSSVFLALEEQESIQSKTPFANAELKKFVKTKEGRMVTGLVREFMEHFNMEFTLAVYDPESNVGDQYEGRAALARDLGVIGSEDTSQLPLLSLLVKQNSGEDGPRKRLPSGAEATPAPSTVSPPLPSPVPTSQSNDKSEEAEAEDLTPKMLDEAKEKFEQYDEDNSGTIEKDELRSLFMDMFPSFHRNMLDRYVNDEFRAADRDFSNAIDFDEFLGMYKRFFVSCKSSVSTEVNDLVSPRHPPPSKIPSPRSRKGDNSVENKNKRNLDSNNTKDTRNLKSDTFQFNEADDDPFFDEPIPSNNNTKSFSSSEKPKKDVKFDTKTTEKASSGGGLASLAGLPSLAPNDNHKSGKSHDLEQDIKAIDQNLTDLGFDVPEDDYDDDFESSKSERSVISSSLDDKGGKKKVSVSPFGATPRSARSDHNVKSLEEELDEEIEEDLSVAEDLLRSDNSGMDDLTTDRTVSPDNQSSAIDYMEDVMVP